MGSLHNREVAYAASDRQGSKFEYCVWRTVSPHSSHHPQEVLLAQFSLHLHKGGLNPHSFHFIHREHNDEQLYMVHLNPREHNMWILKTFYLCPSHPERTYYLESFYFFYVWLRLSLKEQNNNTSYHKICPTLCYIPKQWLLNVYNLLYFFNGRYNYLKCLWRCTIVDYDFGNYFRQNLPK